MTQVFVKVPDDLWTQAQDVAKQGSVSIDELVSDFILEGVERHQALLPLRERAMRADPEKALAILKSLKSLPVEPGDEMPTD